MRVKLGARGTAASLGAAEEGRDRRTMSYVTVATSTLVSAIDMMAFSISCTHSWGDDTRIVHGRGGWHLDPAHIPLELRALSRPRRSAFLGRAKGLRQVIRPLVQSTQRRRVSSQVGRQVRHAVDEIAEKRHNS